MSARSLFLVATFVTALGPVARAQDPGGVAIVQAAAFEVDVTEAEILVDVAPGLALVRQRFVLAPQEESREVAIRLGEGEGADRGVPYLRLGIRLAGADVALTPDEATPGRRTYRGTATLPAGEAQVLAVEGLQLLDWSGQDGELLLDLRVVATELFAAGVDATPEVALRLHALPAEAVVRRRLFEEGEGMLRARPTPAQDLAAVVLALSHDAYLEAAARNAPPELPPDAQLLHQILRLRQPALRGDVPGTLVLLQAASEDAGRPGRMARRLMAGLRDACTRLPKEEALEGGAGVEGDAPLLADAETRAHCADEWVRGEALRAGETPLLPDGLEEEIHAAYHARPRNRGLVPLLASLGVLVLVTLVWFRRRAKG